MSASDRPPRATDEETFPIPTPYGEVRIPRSGVLRKIRRLAPYGMAHMSHDLAWANMRLEDFMAACRHFGLDHLVVDVRTADIGAEMRARRERGAPPTDRPIPEGPAEGSREFADAMLDVYERKVDEATAARAGAAATTGVAPAA